MCFAVQGGITDDVVASVLDVEVPVVPPRSDEERRQQQQAVHAAQAGDERRRRERTYATQKGNRRFNRALDWPASGVCATDRRSRRSRRRCAWWHPRAEASRGRSPPVPAPQGRTHRVSEAADGHEKTWHDALVGERLAHGTYGRDGPSDKAEDADTGTHGSVERHDEEGAPRACRRETPTHTFFTKFLLPYGVKVKGARTQHRSDE